MKTGYIILGVIGVVACAWTGGAFANSQVKDPTTMAIAPSTLLLRCDQGDVSVHTAVPYSLVDTASLSMEGLTPIAVGADLLGDLVMKFDEDDVKALPVVAPPLATLTVTGTLVTGEALILTDVVQVK